MKKTIQYFKDGEQVSVDVPAEYVVCPECSGRGTELRGGMKGYAYSAEEFAQNFSPEEQEEYFRTGGIYDVPCSYCKGRTTVLSPKWNEVDPEIRDAWEEDRRLEAELRAEHLAELKFGC